MEGYQSFFKRVAGVDAAHGWQGTLGSSPEIRNRLICVPTGFGKTLGVLSAWAYNRIARQNEAWPRRLVWCLPMRTLVEQTVAEVERVVAPLGVNVYTVMGGKDAGEWYLHPEVNAVIVGTQDMLLSRALNRGYAAPRARWPMEFGLLNCDCLWVMDEVQLMDVGLATSAQLQQFREEDHAKTFRPSYTWWMSATLQPEWLKSVDTRVMVEKLKADVLKIRPEHRSGPLWEDVSKTVEVVDVGHPDVADVVIDRHTRLADGDYGRITLIVLNRVASAVDLYKELIKRGRTRENTRLVHSRFRGVERRGWREQFLSRSRCAKGTDLVIVATQVVEAGVDISAGCLITDLAPWPSLVQRFGRAARYGGHADIVVLDAKPADDKEAAPYAMTELDEARCALGRLTDVSQKSLDAFDAALSTEERQRLYPYDPPNLLLRKELDELFDTTPDLTGADLDISRFIRAGQERDCQVFWAEWEGEKPPKTLQPHRDALCAVPVYGDSGAQKWMFNKEQLKNDLHSNVFVWDYLDDAWREPKSIREVYPGRLLMVRTTVGGYNVEAGFTGDKPGKNPVAISQIAAAAPKPDELDAAGENNDSLSEAARFQTIAAHGAAVASECVAIAKRCGLLEELARILSIAGRYHDLGKAHPAFRGLIAPSPSSGMQDVPDLAKAPQEAWTGRRTPGFRHELASALALMELLARVDQQHPALLGACRDMISAFALQPEAAPATPVPASLGEELRALTAGQFNLLVYLVCAHHGKVRAALHACPADQETAADDERGMPIRGIKDGDALPPARMMDAQDKEQTVADIDLHLAPAMLGLSGRYGPSWRERTIALQKWYGPFALAWMEALLRVADVRASREVQS
ncbi:MAG: DEAD/DEAH box helicase [Lentisphaerae bacterium]|nr:DEAD/DEAH box helicase [Lentisphaerota bacterium]